GTIYCCYLSTLVIVTLRASYGPKRYLECSELQVRHDTSDQNNEEGRPAWAMSQLSPNMSPKKNRA
ncbi:MAG: hypothetical protein ACWGOX_15360, partial [Desulforhopalus sp.]